MEDFPCSESCSGVTWRLNNSTPIACSSARDAAAECCCETLRLTAAWKNYGIFPGSENHKAIWFQYYAKSHHSHPLRFTWSAALAGILRPFAADNRLSRFKRSFHAGFAVFDHQFAASVYLSPMRSFGAATISQHHCLAEFLPFPGQVKETGYATGERAQGIADTKS